MPNDSFLIGDLENLVVDASAAIPDEPMKAKLGKVVSARKINN